MQLHLKSREYQPVSFDPARFSITLENCRVRRDDDRLKLYIDIHFTRDYPEFSERNYHVYTTEVINVNVLEGYKIED